MTATTANQTRFPAPERWGRWAPALNIVFRIQGVALHLLATWALAATLGLYDTGVFFWGLVITVAGATFMRAKFDLFLSRYVVGHCDQVTGIPASDMLLHLARRFLRRCTLICALLLVIAADIDVMFLNLHRYLETFVPFVLALPFIGLAGMIAAMLQGANRFLLGMICTVFAVNGALLTVTVLSGGEASLPAYSWAFFGGSVFGAALAVLFARYVFGPLSAQAHDNDAAAKARRAEIDRRIETEASIPFAATLLLWGPPCLLVVLAPSVEMALFAIALRSAQVIVYLMPALAFVIAPSSRNQYARFGEKNGHAALLRSLAGIGAASAIMALLLMLAAPVLLRHYGPAYNAAYDLYLVLVIAQALQMASRPVMRYLTVNWNPQMLRRSQIAGCVAALLLCAGIPLYGAMSAALATLIGYAVTGGVALRAALQGPPLKALSSAG